MAIGGHFEHLTSSSVLLLHCIVSQYVFILYMMFHLNVLSAIAKLLVKILLTWDWRFWCHFVSNLLQYMWAKNCQNRACMTTLTRLHLGLFTRLWISIFRICKQYILIKWRMLTNRRDKHDDKTGEHRDAVSDPATGHNSECRKNT